MAIKKYIGARYAPKFMGAWDKASEYAALSVVYTNEQSYVSRKTVPANTEITNTEFWIKSADWNAQVTQYNQNVEQYEKDVQIYAETVNDLVDKTIYTYNTKDDMAADSRVRLNDTLMTCGYTKVNDGGGSFYKVVDKTSSSAIALQNGLFALPFKPYECNEINVRIDKLPLGNNLILADGWIKGNGWNGNFDDGFTHATGNNAALEYIVENYDSAIYILKFTASNQTSTTGTPNLVATVGGVEPYEQYEGDGTVTKYLAFLPSSGNVIFKPSSTWSGTVTDIGLYKIDNQAVLPPSLIIKDTKSKPAFEITANASDLNNIAIGKNTLNKTVSGYNNIAVGNNALNTTPTGYYNTAIGDNAQKDNINGTRNISIGYASMEHITYGNRNIGIGTFALTDITTGRNNIGIGSDAAWKTTTGNNNIAISNGALSVNTTGSGNIALGFFANSDNTKGDLNISIGHLANSYNSTGSHNIAMGYQSHYQGENDLQNIAIGYQAMVTADSDKHTHNIAIGYLAIKNNRGNENIGIGTSVLTGMKNKSEYNIAIGADLLTDISSTGNSCNIAIGESSLRDITGINNIAIGRGISNAGESNNIGIGYLALKNNTTSNNIGIGYNAGINVTSAVNTISINSPGSNHDNSVYIGKALRYNGTTMGVCGLDPQPYANIVIPAGTETKAALVINAGVLKTGTTPGAIEYDGSHLYFTSSNGTRHQISEVN